jgi:hypothetical protein
MLQINNKNLSGIFLNVRNLSNILLNNLWFYNRKRKYFELNDNENTTCQNLWNTTNTVIRDKLQF